MTVAKLPSTDLILKNYNNIIFSFEKHINVTIVTKNQAVENIETLINAGHRVYAENRIDESYNKWQDLKIKYPDIELRLIGKLQTNKIKKALRLFDIIETIDSIKLAEKLFFEMNKAGRWPDCYIQINIGNEIQKNGVTTNEADHFIRYVIDDIGLPVKGLMCIPPKDQDPKQYFLLLKMIAKKHNLSYLSMGMSDDYIEAINCGATHIRLGRAIFNKTL